VAARNGQGTWVRATLSSRQTVISKRNPSGLFTGKWLRARATTEIDCQEQAVTNGPSDEGGQSTIPIGQVERALHTL
jgi:hypothetical protein